MSNIIDHSNKQFDNLAALENRGKLLKRKIQLAEKDLAEIRSKLEEANLKLASIEQRTIQYENKHWAVEGRYL
jgi:5-bromo-4-chloroindolyl phosphate hydrolysis protein